MTYTKKYDPFFQLYSSEYNIFDWKILKAQGIIESGLNENAKSSAGACGLMQFMPNTWNWIKENEDDNIMHPELQIKYAAKYMNWIYSHRYLRKIVFFDRYMIALKAYNSGLKWVKRIMEIVDKQDVTFLEIQLNQHKLIDFYNYSKASYKENYAYPNKVLEVYLKFLTD